MLDTAFLEDIVQHPDDEAVRLIYADWLEERGDPRGEFIRVQCQLARWEEGTTDLKDWAYIAANLPALRQREQELREKHGVEWSDDLGDWRLPPVFRRGFVEGLTLSVSDFLKRGDEYFRRTPLREVTFAPPGNSVLKLAASPLLERLTRISLLRWYENAGVIAFLSSSHLNRLEELDLGHAWNGDDPLRSLAEAPLLGRLTRLVFRSNRITLGGLRLLLLSPEWKRLHYLSLYPSRIASENVTALVQELTESEEAWRLLVLWRWFDEERKTFRNPFARQLAAEAGRDADPVAFLARALASSSHRRRAAAAQMLGWFGVKAIPALPALVTRLYEGGNETAIRRVGHRVADTLARLAPHLSRPMQLWLGVLANPWRSPSDNLYSAVRGQRLPEAVVYPFVDLCLKRFAWWSGVTLRKEEILPHPSTADWQAQWGLITRLLKQGGEITSEREAAWLLGRLCELLLQHFSLESA